MDISTMRIKKFGVSCTLNVKYKNNVKLAVHREVSTIAISNYDEN